MSVLRNRSRSQRQWTHRTAGLAAAAWLGLTACTSSPEALPTPKPPAVTVVTVAQRAVPVYGQYVGQTEAVKTVEIRARVEGFLERQVVPDGADVKAGDILFVIDPRPFEATLRQTQANVARDTAQLHQTEAALIQREADMQNARAVIRADEAAVDSAQIQLGYTTIRSPLDGRMGRAEVRVGSLVGRQDSTLLATLSTLDPMYVNFSVSEREALSVWRYRTAPTGPSGITMTLPDDSAYPHDGRLDFVDRAVDPRTGTLALRATFANPRRLLQPGQYMRLRILLDERAGAVVVPQAAVQESQGSASLFVVGPDRTVQARTFRMGPRFGPLWVVEAGVKPGEQVVIKGLQQVRAGMRVEPTVEPLPPAPGS